MDTQPQADDRLRYLTGKVKDLETALRDAKAEVRALRIENRTLAEQLANRNPNLYSSAAVLEWIQDDMLPTHANAPAAAAAAAAGAGDTPAAEVGATPSASSRRSRAGPASQAIDAADGPGPATPGTSNKSMSRSAGGRGSPAPTGRHASADPTPRPGSSLGRASSVGSSSAHPAAALASTNAPSSSSSSSAPSGVWKKAILSKGIDLDAATGLPTNLPVDVGNIKLVSLGEVIFDDGFHNERNIFPLGFTTRREYQSATVKDSLTSYTCTVVRATGGGSGAAAARGGPVFQVTAADNPHAPFMGTSSTDVWTQVIKAANQVCGRHASLKISGPELFGLNHPLIVHWIQKLPHAKELPRYHMQEVVVVDARGRSSVGPAKGGVAVKKEKGVAAGSSAVAGVDDGDKMDVDEPMDQS